MDKEDDVLKAVQVIVCVFLILPAFIISAVPNIFFGYDSSSAADVMAMTDRAYSIDAAYSAAESYTQEQIDQIIANAQAEYQHDYDETAVTTDIGNTNLYWFISITSVWHKQDLFLMDAGSIRDMTGRKLKSSAYIWEKAVGEETIRILQINIWDLAPEPLMAELGFDREQENWAHALYRTVADEQLAGYTDSDGDGYYGTNYGDIAFAGAAVEVVYYNQTDARWGNKMYGKSGTIGTSGCGPAALAMAVETLKGGGVTPADVARWSVENGHRAEGSGSYHSLIPAGGSHYGLAVTGIGRDANKLEEALKEGKLVIGIMGKGHFTSSGHFILLRGITPGGKILVADPASLKRSNQEWKLSVITGEARRGAGSGGPFWVISL